MVLDHLAFTLDSEGFDPEHRPATSASELLKEIRFLSEERFWQYVPAPLKFFESRLAAWLENRTFSHNQLRTMLELVTAIEFVDREDMSSLYRSAFRGPVIRWLADRLGWTAETFVSSDSSIMKQALVGTWFCPVTDSMDIAHFLHVNQIGGNRDRPSWNVLAKFGDFKRVRAYFHEREYKRLVLLEDFVGSGVQAGEAVRCALRELPGVDVLFVPLLVSAAGVNRYTRIAARHTAFTFESVSVIPQRMHLFSTPQPDEFPLFAAVRQIVEESAAQVLAADPDETDPPKHALGFCRQYGLLLVQHTNCPNNTLPVIWRNAPSWSGLFPRVPRW